MEKTFLDSNILLYLNFTNSEFHNRAVETIEEYIDNYEFYISSQVIREYVRVASIEITEDIISQQVNVLKNQFTVLYDNEKVIDTFVTLVNKYKIKGIDIYDCNLVATMSINGIKNIITNDKGFFKYKDIIKVIPLKEKK